MTPAGDELEVAAVRGAQRDRLKGMRVPLEAGIDGWVVREQQPLILNGVVKDPRFLPLHPRAEIQSAICMPLLAARRLVGVLNVNSLQSNRQFTPGQVRALSILASTAAAALQSAALYERSERLRQYNESVLQTISEGLLLTDHSGRLTYVNAGALRLAGYSAGEVLGRHWALFVPADERARSARQSAAQAEAPANGAQAHFETRLKVKDGREIPVLISTTPFASGQQQPGTLVVFTDITERKQAEAELEHERSLLRTLIDNVPDFIYAKDTASRFVLANLAAARSLGQIPENVVGKTDFDFHAPELATQFMADEQAVLQSGQSLIDREEMVIVDGREQWLLTTTVPLRDGAGQIVGLVGISRNITERQQTEAALAQERSLLRTLIDNVPDFIYTKDTAGRFLLANRSTASSLGLTPAELVGKNDFDFHTPEMAAQYFADEQAVMQSGQAMVDREELVMIGGQEQWMLTTSVPLRDSAGQVMGLVGIARNITDRRQRERELEAIAAVSASLRTAQVRSEMVPVVLDELLALLGAAGAALGSRDPVSGERMVELARGAWAGITGRRLGATGQLDAGRRGGGTGLLDGAAPAALHSALDGGVFATGQLFVTDDAGADPRLGQLAAGGQVRAIACLPLIAEGRAAGVVWVGRAAPFSSGDLRLLTAVTNIAANALHRVTLHEQVEQRLERLAALRAIDRAISGSLDLRVVLNVLLDQVVGQLRVDAGAVVLLNPHTRTLDYAAQRGFRSASAERSRGGLTWDHGGRAVLERRLVSVPDTAHPEPGQPALALPPGETFRAYFGAPLLAKGSVVGVLEVYHRTPVRPLPEWLEFLEALAELAAIAIDNARLFDNLQHSNLNLTVAYDATIEGWSRALDLRDKETEGHTQRVTEMSLRLGRALGLSEGELVHMRRGALLHDIGKMGVPDQILLKPGPLSDEEWVTMRRHPVYAYEMLAPIVYLHPALDIPYCHHEKWDGSGYPRGLAGEQIPLAARLFAVVDVWDALRSDRPYRAAWGEERVSAHIRSLVGTHFDPQAAEGFLNLLSAPPD